MIEPVEKNGNLYFSLESYYYILLVMFTTSDRMFARTESTIIHLDAKQPDTEHESEPGELTSTCEPATDINQHPIIHNEIASSNAIFGNQKRVPTQNRDMQVEMFFVISII